jgi:hypothetical protein
LRNSALSSVSLSAFQFTKGICKVEPQFFSED